LCATFLQHFPSFVVANFNWTDVTEIDVVDAETDEITKCTLNTVTSNSGYVQKHLTKGWYEFVRSKNLTELDRIVLGVENPVDHVMVHVIRPKT